MTYPVDWSKIRDALWQWFSTASDVATIWGNKNAPQPSYPYATITVQSGGITLGALDEERWTDDGGLTFVGQRDLTLSCQIHVGPPGDQDGLCNAHSRMSAVLASLATPKVQRRLEAAGLSLRERGTPQTLDILVGTEWVNRVQADFLFGVASVLELDPETEGWFNKVEISSDLSPLQGTGSLNLNNEILDPNA